MNPNPYTSQPPWIDGQTVEGQIRERSFIRSVYGWMFGGLLLTALAALWVVSSPFMQSLLFSSRVPIFVLVIAEFGLVIYLSARAMRMSPGAAGVAFFAFAFINGLMLSSIFFTFTASSITEAFVVSAGMYGAMSVYGLVTKRDLTSWGSFFFMGLVGLVLMMIVSFFVHAAALQMAIATIGIFVFVGLTAYDTQRLKALANSGVDTMAVFGALQLYLDFINLFLFVLRLLGDRRR